MVPELQIVHVRIQSEAGEEAIPARIRIATPDGRYWPPAGCPEHVPPQADARYAGNVLLHDQPWAYLGEQREFVLPSGPLHVHISAGPAYELFQETIVRQPGQIALRFRLKRCAEPLEPGWYAGDAHVSDWPLGAAALEGAAEGLHLVHVLVEQDPRSGVASQLVDFSAQQPALVRFGCQVYVATRNCHPWLGCLHLLNCHRVVLPLTLPRPGFERYTLYDWARQCHRKGGLVIWPKFDKAGAEHLTDLLLGQVDAVEWSAMHAWTSDTLSAYYRLLGLGLAVPIVGSSGKRTADTPIGAVRTYAWLGSAPFTYRAWIEAIRRGQSYASAGPQLHWTVNDHPPGGHILPAPDRVRLMLRVLGAPGGQVEVVGNGSVLASYPVPGSYVFSAPVTTPGWLALRVWQGGQLMAHTAPTILGKPHREREAVAWALANLGDFEKRVTDVGTPAADVLAQRIRQARTHLLGRSGQA